MRTPRRLRRPARQVRGGGRSFRAESRGNLLLISGILLLLGFVTLGGALVHMNSLEGTTARVQDEGMIVDVDELVVAMRTSLMDSIVGRQMNASNAESIVESLGESLVRSAARAGLYVSIVGTSADPKIWDRIDRCKAYNRAETSKTQGIVIGYTEGDLRKAIAGVAYDVHATDGRQNLYFQYYVLIERCADTETTFVHAGIHVVDPGTGPLGTVTGPLAMTAEDGQFTTFTEELDWSTLQFTQMAPTIIPASIQTTHWNHPDELKQWPGQAKLVSSAPNMPGNKVGFKMEAPEALQDGDRLQDVKVNVYSWLRNAPSDWRLQLLVFHPEGTSPPAITRTIPVTTTMQNHTIVLQDGPSGPGWTKDEIEDSLWMLRVVGEHEASQEIYIKYFDMVGLGRAPAGYRLDARIDWPEMPEGWSVEQLRMRYRIPQAMTPGERFEFQIAPKGIEDDWLTLVELEHGTGEWQEVDQDVSSWPDVEASTWQRPWFRIVDTDMDDNDGPQDQDSIEIDYLFLHSGLDV